MPSTTDHDLRTTRSKWQRYRIASLLALLALVPAACTDDPPTTVQAQVSSSAAEPRTPNQRFVELLQQLPFGSEIDQTLPSTFTQAADRATGVVIGTIASTTEVRDLPNSIPLPSDLDSNLLTSAAIDIVIQPQQNAGVDESAPDAIRLRLVVYEGRADDASVEFALDSSSEAIEVGARAVFLVRRGTEAPLIEPFGVFVDNGGGIAASNPYLQDSLRGKSLDDVYGEISPHFK